MKKFSVILLVCIAAMVFTYCSSSKKATTATPEPPKVMKVNYQANVKPLLEMYCAPCHFPDKGGNKKALDTYSMASAQVDEVIRRISLNPGDRGFMPSRKPKLSDSTINVIKQWKADGLTEK